MARVVIALGYRLVAFCYGLLTSGRFLWLVGSGALVKYWRQGVPLVATALEYQNASGGTFQPKDACPFRGYSNHLRRVNW
jgi:hypothetical protein